MKTVEPLTRAVIVSSSNLVSGGSYPKVLGGENNPRSLSTCITHRRFCELSDEYPRQLKVFDAFWTRVLLRLRRRWSCTCGVFAWCHGQIASAATTVADFELTFNFHEGHLTKPTSRLGSLFSIPATRKLQNGVDSKWHAFWIPPAP